MNQFVEIVRLYTNQHPTLRLGQAYMCCCPFELYQTILDTESDCFYDDSKIPQFLTTLEKWYNLNPES